MNHPSGPVPGLVGDAGTADTAPRVVVNGVERPLRAAPSMRLSDWLRDDLGLVGTKVGCSAGDCGACTVLVDGEQACACIVPVGQCEGAEVLTVEGLAGDAGLSALQRAFIAHGAAQCGICTPGMLMAATDLLRRVPAPTEAQALDGLAGVLCRCTGYRKIVEAVLSVARGDAGAAVAEPAPAAGAAVGARLPRLDAPSKVTGAEVFGADEAPADALWLRAIRSPHPHARFELGDLDALVRATPGLVGVVRPSDVPNNRFAIFPDLRDQPAVAESVARFRGEAVLVLAGERAAIEALDAAAVPIAWTPLPALETPAAALADGVAPLHARYPDNVLCRGRVVRGDVDAELAAAPRRATIRVTTSHVEHAYIEPEAGWARWIPGEGGSPARVEVFACTQTPYMDRDELAWMFGLPPANVRIVPSAVGGGFGGKLDISVQPLIVAAARKFGRPARMVYTRPESMASSTKRHPAEMSATLAADADGRLRAYDFHGDFDTGAYASWGPTVANRVPIHASGPYRFAAVRATTRAVHTHGPVAGAFRGFGVPQSTVVVEALLDELALEAGLDPLDLRHAHALRAGDTTPTGQRLGASVGLRACLEALRPAWVDTRARCEAFNAAATGPLRRGVGVACMWYGIGNTVIANPSTMTVGLRRDGRFMLYNGAVDIGQGTYTIMPQLAADALGVPVSALDQIRSDTSLTEDAGKSSASRQTFVSGNAARFAALDLRSKLVAIAGLDAARAGEAALRTDGTVLVVTLDGRDTRVDLAALPADPNGDVAVGRGRFDPPTVPLDADGQGVPYATYGFAAQFAEVEVDVELGTTKVVAIHAAHDVGRAVNPTQVEGQVHGGIAQGLGMALMEEYRSGRTDNLHDYLIPTVGDVPPIVVHLVEDPEPLGPWGAKGVGEPALVATAPAILNAIRHATGVRATHLPVTPDRLRARLREPSR
ncbi:MAG: molybdopterin cofactor-binding domain-containing protein [Burkholderiales bacterium]|jgi:CO/xanthine dehydrogenase Mo-binding subunit/aerobic-type carbon monoxide dehydrogenase small subunit (CoxS/CutS family)